MIISARHSWSEKAGFTIDRPVGLDNYTFLHFLTGITLRIGAQEEPRFFPPGACLIYAPQTPQWFYSQDELLHDWMHLSTEAGALFDLYHIPVDQVFYLADASFVTANLFEIELEVYGLNEYGENMANAKLHQMLIHISRACNAAPARPLLNAELSAVLGHLRLHIMQGKHQQWTLERMAAEARMSVSRFCAVYKAQFGISPMNDLIQMRIDAAKNLLTGSKISISDLACQLGYANVTHFNRQFKKATGVSPTAFVKAKQSAAER